MAYRASEGGGNLSEPIREDEWLAELERLQNEKRTAPEGYLTIRELAAAWDVDDALVRRRLQKLQGAGRLECARVRRPAIDGRNAMVPAYRLKPTST